MDGIILINKEKGLTSRDVVNIVSKKIGCRKVGHTGTLDPLATGLMVLCVGEGTKLVEMLTGHDKDYIAKVKLGMQTDTYDVTGNIINRDSNYLLKKDDLEKTLLSFNGEYEQEVPIYSAIKVQGKKLYEYARSGKSVNLPKHLVKISNMKLIDIQDDSVSSGTYIRSLINDIGKKLGIYMTMEELCRTRVGKYCLENASSIDDLKIIPLINILDIKKINLDDTLLKKIKNGVKIPNIYHEKKVMFVNDGQAIAIYQDMGNDMMRSYRVFNNK